MRRSDDGADPPSGSKADAVYAVLKARVLDGTYPPGFRLGMSGLASELGVSALPVREAVRRLEAESLVRFERNIGATVAGLDLHEYAWTVETLAVLDAAAVGLSVGLLEPGEIAEARRLNERLRECLDDGDSRQFRVLDQRFHEVLARHCPNPAIAELVARSWARLGAARSMPQERGRACIQEHDQILALVEAGASAERVEKAVRRHHENGLASIRQDPASSAP